MVDLNALIAQSGQALYENVRKGFFERPEEARQRKLEELTISRNELQQQAAQAELQDYQASANLREAQRQEQMRQLGPEMIARKEKMAEMGVTKLTNELEKQTLEIAGMKDKKARDDLIFNKTKYSEIILGAVTQKTAQDAMEYIRQNKEALLKYGTPEEDQTVETLLNSKPEEQAHLLSILEKAQPTIQNFMMALEKIQAKAVTKAMSKETPKPGDKDMEEDITRMMEDDPEIGIGATGWMGSGVELSNRDRTKFINTVKQTAKEIMRLHPNTSWEQAKRVAFQGVRDQLERNRNLFQSADYRFKEE